MVVIFIKNSKFDKAKEVLNKHFPKPVVGKVSPVRQHVNSIFTHIDVCTVVISAYKSYSPVEANWSERLMRVRFNKCLEGYTQLSKTPL